MNTNRKLLNSVIAMAVVILSADVSWANTFNSGAQWRKESSTTQGQAQVYTTSDGQQTTTIINPDTPKIDGNNAVVQPVVMIPKATGSVQDFNNEAPPGIQTSDIDYALRFSKSESGLQSDYIVYHSRADNQLHTTDYDTFSKTHYYRALDLVRPEGLKNFYKGTLPTYTTKVSMIATAVGSNAFGASGTLDATAPASARQVTPIPSASISGGLGCAEHLQNPYEGNPIPQTYTQISGRRDTFGCSVPVTAGDGWTAFAKQLSMATAAYAPQSANCGLSGTGGTSEYAQRNVVQTENTLDHALAVELTPPNMLSTVSVFGNFNYYNSNIPTFQGADVPSGCNTHEEPTLYIHSYTALAAPAAPASQAANQLGVYGSNNSTTSCSYEAEHSTGTQNITANGFNNPVSQGYSVPGAQTAAADCASQGGAAATGSGAVAAQTLTPNSATGTPNSPSPYFYQNVNVTDQVTYTMFKLSDLDNSYVGAWCIEHGVEDPLTDNKRNNRYYSTLGIYSKNLGSINRYSDYSNLTVPNRVCAWGLSSAKLGLSGYVSPPYLFSLDELNKNTYTNAVLERYLATGKTQIRIDQLTGNWFYVDEGGASRGLYRFNYPNNVSLKLIDIPDNSDPIRYYADVRNK